MGLTEWPLIVFTVLAQMAVGAYVLAALAIFFCPGDVDDKLQFERWLLPIWVLLGLGFLSSMMHLGTPMRGINAIFRFGQAALSNEIVFGTSFLAVGAIAWLLAAFDRGPGLRKVLYGAAFILGLSFIWNMANFYLMPTVPTWNTPLTPAAFTATALIGGALLVNVLLALSGLVMPEANRTLGGLALLGIAAALVITLMLTAGLPAFHSAAHEASALAPDMGLWQAARFVLLMVAVLISFRFASGHRPLVPLALLGLIMVVAAEMIGRAVFFALHMTVGVV